MSDSYAPADRQIARAAGVVMVGFVLSSLTGLAKWVLVSHGFGTGAEIDAFNAANRVPDLLFNLMAAGALASAFIPTFTSFLTQDDRSGGWRLASSIANLVFVVMSAAAVVVWFLAPWLVRYVLAPGFDGAQITLTVNLLRLLLPTAVIYGISGLLMGVLNAHQHFLLPALAPTMSWLGWILGVLVLAPRMGIMGLAWGVVVGAVMHLLVQLPALPRRKPRYHLTFGLRNPAVRQVGRLIPPRLLGSAVVQINFLVNTMLASMQPIGSLTGITLGFVLMLMPQGVIAQAIAIAALPTFSEQVARGEIKEMRSSLASTLRGVVFLALPASLGLILLRRPLVAVLFQRGAFDAQSTEQVSWALLWFAAGLVGHSLLEIVSRAFYAMKDTKTPAFVGTAAMTLNVIFSLAFSALFVRLGWMPHGGLALANSLATAIESAVLLWLMSRRLQGLDLVRIRRGLLSTLLASVVMTSAVFGWTFWMRESPAWLLAVGGVVVGGGIYWLAALLLKAPEARRLPRILLSKS
ncbi:MAG TPA: murein biosynthesis integral membrane protein MurJ [Anaerolineae bacterium]|nr:murein biosynthesis integral membrane protein MurJ [Anaerolineae bacterium]